MYSTDNTISSFKMVVALATVPLAAVMAVAEVMVAMAATEAGMIPVELGIFAVICGVPIRCANVWEAICAHAVKSNEKNGGSGCLVWDYDDSSDGRNDDIGKYPFFDGTFCVFNRIFHLPLWNFKWNHAKHCLSFVGSFFESG